jgi:hypothetical protein
MKVATFDIRQVGGWFSDWAWHRPVTHFKLGDTATPPESGPLRFPERERYDRVCFYFS